MEQVTATETAHDRTWAFLESYGVTTYFECFGKGDPGRRILTHPYKLPKEIVDKLVQKDKGQNSPGYWRKDIHREERDQWVIALRHYNALPELLGIE